MKLKIESISHQSFLIVIIPLVFMAVPIGVVAAAISFSNEIGSIDLFLSFGLTKLLIFCGFEFIGIYLMFYLFKKPKEYSATLIDKELIDTGTEKYYYVKFKADDKKNMAVTSNQYEGYIYEQNDLKVGNKYLIGIKEFNWMIKYVKDYDKEKVMKNKKKSASPFFMFFALIFYCFSLDLLITGIITSIDSHIVNGLPCLILGIIILSITIFLHISLTPRKK